MLLHNLAIFRFVFRERINKLFNNFFPQANSRQGESRMVRGGRKENRAGISLTTKELYIRCNIFSYTILTMIYISESSNLKFWTRLVMKFWGSYNLKAFFVLFEGENLRIYEHFIWTEFGKIRLKYISTNDA